MIDPGKNGRRSVAKGRCEAGCFAKNERPLVRWILTPLACVKPALGRLRNASLRAARNGARRAVADNCLGLVASFAEGEGNGDDPPLLGTGGTISSIPYPPGPEGFVDPGICSLSTDLLERRIQSL